MNLNWFDFVIIAVIGLSILISLFRGFLREIISIITWVLGVIVAIRFMPQVAEWFKTSISSPGLRSVLAFACLFLSVFIVGSIVGAIIKHCIDATGFSIVDRILGVAFGAARGILLVAVVLIFFSLTQYQNSDMMVNSSIAPRFTTFNTWLKSFFPKQLEQIKQWISQDKTPSSEVKSQGGLQSRTDR